MIKSKLKIINYMNCKNNEMDMIYPSDVRTLLEKIEYIDYMNMLKENGIKPTKEKTLSNIKLIATDVGLDMRKWKTVK